MDNSNDIYDTTGDRDAGNGCRAMIAPAVKITNSDQDETKEWKHLKVQSSTDHAQSRTDGPQPWASTKVQKYYHQSHLSVIRNHLHQDYIMMPLENQQNWIGTDF